MSTSNGIAAPASMVDLELVQCSKAKSDRHSFATAETRRLSRSKPDRNQPMKAWSSLKKLHLGEKKSFLVRF